MSDARFAALLFATAFLVRLVAWMGLAIFGSDSAQLMTMADFMWDGRFHEALAIAYHPLYPLLVAMGRGITGSSESAGYAVSILLGSSAVVPLFYLVKELFGRPAGFLTGVIYAFYSSTVSSQVDIMSDATFIFFFLSSLWLTWRTAEEPSAEGAVVTGMAAAGAYLARPEGLLCAVTAAGWLLFEFLRRRNIRLLGASALLLVVLILAASPYLFWVKSMRGRWGWSYRPSAVSAERMAGIQDPNIVWSKSEAVGSPRLYRKYGASLLRLTLYGALIPFQLIGLASLRRESWRKSLFLLGISVAYLAAVLLSLRKQAAMSDRYLAPPMTLLWSLAGLGMARTLSWFSRRWPEARWRPAASGALIVAFAVIPHASVLFPRRLECRSYPLAARWLRSQQAGPGLVPSSVTQVNYLAGIRATRFPQNPDELRALVRDDRVRYFVYSEQDVALRQALSAELRAVGVLEPPVLVESPPGTERILVQRVR